MTRTDAEVEALLGADVAFPALTERSARGLPALLEALRAGRERGWAIDGEESFRGIIGVAVPLDGWSPADPQLALGVAIPAADAGYERIERVGRALQEAARQLTNPFSAAARA